MELFSTKYRARAGIFSAIAANSGGLLYALLAYLVKDWKYIQLATAFVPLIQFFLLW